MNFARSDSCCATCLASTAPVYSRLKVRFVIETSSRTMLKYFARCVSRFLMSLLTTYTNTRRTPSASFSNISKLRQSQDMLADDECYLSHCEQLAGIVLCNDALQCFLRTS